MWKIFSAASATSSDDPAKTTVALADVVELQRLIAQPLYSEADKARILEILKKHKATGTSGPFFLQETRRRLYSHGKIVSGRTGRLGRVN